MSLPHRPTAFDLLVGKGSYAPLPSLLEGLRAEHLGVRPEGFAHSLYQQLWHVVYWQDRLVARLKGNNPKPAEHAAEGWPTEPGPARPEAWAELLERFLQGASSLDVLAADVEGDAAPQGSVVAYAVAEMAVHNAYHAGQMVQLRQALGLWPPPAGGDTW